MPEKHSAPFFLEISRNFHILECKMNGHKRKTYWCKSKIMPTNKFFKWCLKNTRHRFFHLKSKMFVHVICLYMLYGCTCPRKSFDWSKEVVWLVQRNRLTGSKKLFEKCFSSRCLMDVSRMTVTKKIFCHKLYDREKRKILPYITWPRKKKFAISYMTAKKKNFTIHYMTAKKKILPYVIWSQDVEKKILVQKIIFGPKSKKKILLPTLSGPKTSFDWSKEVVWLVQKSRLTGPKKSFDWSKEVVWLCPKKSFDWSKKPFDLVKTFLDENLLSEKPFRLPVKTFLVKTFLVKTFLVKTFLVKTFLVKTFLVKTFLVKTFLVKTFLVKTFLVKTFLVKTFLVKNLLSGKKSLVKTFLVKTFLVKTS